MKTKLPIILLVMLALFAGSPALAVMGVTRSSLIFTIIDAAVYKNPALVQIDLLIHENAESSTDHILIPGRRITVQVSTEYLNRLMIGQKIKADFSGAIDDLGSGRIKIMIHPETLEILETPLTASKIEFSRWEPFFDALPFLKIVLIAFGWLLTFELCFRLPEVYKSN
ncbi:MAG: hypothetical protein AB1403_09645 [Candidatus Riflebacteria bacterium]